MRPSTRNTNSIKHTLDGFIYEIEHLNWCTEAAGKLNQWARTCSSCPNALQFAVQTLSGHETKEFEKTIARCQALDPDLISKPR